MFALGSFRKRARDRISIRNDRFGEYMCQLSDTHKRRIYKFEPSSVGRHLARLPSCAVARIRANVICFVANFLSNRSHRSRRSTNRVANLQRIDKKLKSSSLNCITPVRIATVSQNREIMSSK
jgi:hypothetical protein